MFGYIRAIVILLLFFAGIVPVSGNPLRKLKPVEYFSDKTEVAAHQLAERFTGALVQSLKSGDFASFSKMVQGAAPGKFRESDFTRMRTSLESRYGKFVSAGYLGVLNQGQVRDYLWKFTFVGKDKSGMPQPREIIFWVRTGVVNKEPVIAGFSYKFF